MLKIVSNTTPIISLLKINKLNLLQKLYGEIIIPQEVYFEIEKGKSKNYYIDLNTIDWIRILKISNPEAVSYFIDLDKGEAETIILANEIKADLVIIDEILGRFHANNIELKVTGTIGLLLKAKEAGHIDQIKPLLYELKNKGIWLSEDLINEILKLANE
ncbi:MAG: DUF3368 domain-containing protein [Flavobacteriia bacterium]|nr:DUF3368 domain-containing protein [Flavobacteriia bacterium]